MQAQVADRLTSAPQPSAPQPSAPQPSAPQPSAPQPSAPQPSAPPRTPEPASPRRAFASICLDRMRELEQHFRKSAELCNKLELREGEAHGVSGKRRKLAHAAIGSITRTLRFGN